MTPLIDFVNQGVNSLISMARQEELSAHPTWGNNSMTKPN